MSSGSCSSSVLLLPQFFLCMWVAALFFKSPSALFWFFALQLLVEKTITFNFTTVYQSLYTMFSWFCSFHSASVPGGYSSSHGLSPIRYSFEHSSIPSPTYTTICSAIPQLKGISSFSNFLLPQRVWDSFLFHKSLSIVLYLCIAISREIHYVWLYHSVSVSVYNVLLVLFLSLCIGSWRLFQFP